MKWFVNIQNHISLKIFKYYSSIFRTILLGSIIISVIFIPLSSVVSRMSKRARLKRAVTLYKKSLNQDDIRALITLNKALKLDKRNTDILFRVGYLYHKMSRKKKALEFYTKTLHRKPCHVKANNNMGGIFLDLNKQFKAEKHYLRAVKCNTKFYPAYYNLGSIYQNRKQYNKAKRFYIFTIRLKSDHYRSRHNLGQIYYIYARRSGIKKGDRQMLLRKALYQFKKACSLKPDNAINQYSLGKLLIELGRVNEGLRAMKKAMRHSKRGSSLQLRIHRSIHETKTRFFRK